MIVWDDRVADWVAFRLGYETGFGNCKALGVIVDGELRGGVVYHDWQPKNGTIQLSAASTGKPWTNKNTIATIWGYPLSFCQMAWAQTDMDNTARGIWKKLGADEYLVPRLLGREKDGVLLTLTDDKWRETRFARLYDGQTAGTNAS